MQLLSDVYNVDRPLSRDFPSPRRVDRKTIPSTVAKISYISAACSFL